MALQPIKQVRGTGVYVPGDDIDTDQIIPARFMRCVTFDGLGEYAFYDRRFDQSSASLGHPLDDPRFAGAGIFVTGRNFGCGSSREHAPQAMYRFGIRAVVGESFAEIFFDNGIAIGMPCVSVGHDDARQIGQAIEADPKVEIVVDIEQQIVRIGDLTIRCTMPENGRQSLLAGTWDALEVLLTGADQARALAQRLPY
jgi:3-isopropylmalate/(R)-2-methylmalate dehydratase small subunit